VATPLGFVRPPKGAVLLQTHHLFEERLAFRLKLKKAKRLATSTISIRQALNC
jgi:hypothetical protein